MDLIERLRGSLYACHAIRGYLDDAGLPDDGDAHGQLPEIEATLTEAAAALEAAREDAERWRQAFVDGRASRHRADGMKIEQARIHAETDAVVAAIDQARGKGVQDEA